MKKYRYEMHLPKLPQNKEKMQSYIISSLLCALQQENYITTEQYQSCLPHGANPAHRKYPV